MCWCTMVQDQVAFFWPRKVFLEGRALSLIGYLFTQLAQFSTTLLIAEDTE